MSSHKSTSSPTCHEFTSPTTALIYPILHFVLVTNISTLSSCNNFCTIIFPPFFIFVSCSVICVRSVSTTQSNALIHISSLFIFPLCHHTINQFHLRVTHLLDLWHKQFAWCSFSFNTTWDFALYLLHTFCIFGIIIHYDFVLVSFDFDHVSSAFSCMSEFEEGRLIRCRMRTANHRNVYVMLGHAGT